MAFPFVQAGSVVTGGSSVAPSIAGTTAGNTLILTVTWDAATASVGAPTTPSGWTVVGSISGTNAWNATGTSGGVIVYYQTSAGGTVSATVTGATNTTDMVAQISEWSASAALTYASATANVNNTSNQTTVATGTITPPQANYLLITVGASSGSTSTDTISQSTTGTSAPTLTSLGSFTNGSTTMDALFEYGIGTTTNTLTTTYTCNTQTGMATMGVVFKYTPASSSPVVDNATVAQPQMRRPDVFPSMVLGSMLLTALAPGLPPQPLVSSNGRLDVLQDVRQAPRGFLNADTTRSTPKTLFADAVSPSVDAPSFAPVHHPRNEGLNQDSTRGNWLTLNASRTFLDHFYGPQEFRRTVVDTSQSASQALLGSGAVAAPFNSNPGNAVFWPWKLTDTSQNTPKALYSDAVSAIVNAPGYQVATPRIGGDTSQSSGQALLSSAAAPPPFVPVQSTQVERPRQSGDTSQSSGIVLTAAAASPFQAPESWAPYRFNWQPPDTSQSVAKVQTPDATTPAQNLPQAAPDRVRQIADTSRSSGIALVSGVQAPLVNSPSVLVERPRQTQDTSQSAPIALQGVTPAPFNSVPTGAVERPRQTQDTSQATPKALYADATTPVANAPTGAVERPRQTQDTSQSASVVLQGVTAAPFTPTSTAGVERPRQTQDTSQGAFAALNVLPAPAFGATQPLVERPRQPEDTSQGAYAAQFAPPVFGFSQTQVERPRQPQDTSQAPSQALLTPVVVPAQNPPASAPPRFWYQPPDTSQSQPLALFPVGSVVFANIVGVQTFPVAADPLDTLVHVRKHQWAKFHPARPGKATIHGAATETSVAELHVFVHTTALPAAGLPSRVEAQKLVLDAGAPDLPKVEKKPAPIVRAKGKASIQRARQTPTRVAALTVSSPGTAKVKGGASTSKVGRLNGKSVGRAAVQINYTDLAVLHVLGVPMTAQLHAVGWKGPSEEELAQVVLALLRKA